jgi:hypothetical protein
MSDVRAPAAACRAAGTLSRQGGPVEATRAGDSGRDGGARHALKAHDARVSSHLLLLYVWQVPTTLSELKPHSYGTAVCTAPVEFEHGKFAFGQEEVMPIKIVGPESLFELVVQMLVGVHTDVKSELAEAEAMKFDFLMSAGIDADP